MKALLKLFFVVLVALTLAGVSYAQAPSGTKAAVGAPVARAEAKEEGPRVSRAVGEVTAVDPDGGTLRVRTKDKELLFTPGSKAARRSLETLKAGDTVTVSYFEKEGYLVAPSIEKPGGKTKLTSDGKKKSKSEPK
jgi:hypothetical protein